MEEHTYKLLELTGSSTHGSDDAIRNAIKRAGKTVKNLDWFKVIESRGYLDDGDVKYWQVTIKVGFRIED